jgi:hypothetical protein
MASMYRLVMFAFLSCSLSCAQSNRSAEIFEVRPNQIASNTSVTIDIVGSGFYVAAVVDLDNENSALTDSNFGLRIGSQEVSPSQVQRQSSELLRATLPSLSDGVYDLVVTFPDGSEAELLQALRVGSAQFDAGVAADAGAAADASAGGDDASTADAGATTALLDTLIVPSNGAIVTSNIVLQAGQTYLLRVTGTFTISTTEGWLGDAEYFDFADVPTSLQDTVIGVDNGVGINDLVVDSIRSPRWGPYNPSHIYERSFVGLGATIQANFHDGNYTNNVGSLTLEIRQ